MRGRHKLAPFIEEVGLEVRAELLKLDKRTSTWVLLGVTIAILSMITYFLSWLSLVHQQSTADPARMVQLVQLRHGLYPTQLLSKVLDTAELASALALTLGVIMVGSEFGWGTFKTLFTQRGGRRSALVAKILALLLALGIAVVLFFLVGALSSGIIGAVDQQPLNQWPALVDVLKAVFYAWLIWGFWGIFGIALALLFRQTALPLVLGLIYHFGVEQLLVNLTQNAGDFLSKIPSALPGQNVAALSAAYDVVSPGSPAPSIGQNQAILVLLAYTAGAIIFALILISRGEVK